MKCERCGTENPDHAKFCGGCGGRFDATDIGLNLQPAGESDAAQYSGAGAGAGSDLPAAIKGFNFGAFALTFIWALGNRIWILGIVVLITSCLPPVTLAFAIYLGINGNALAWKARAFSSIQEFKETQKVWAIAGIVIFVLGIGAVPFVAIMAAIAVPNFLRAKDTATFTRCVESLSGVKVAEELFITDNGTYTTDKNLLAINMIAGCTDPTGKAPNCNGVVDSRVKNNCDKTADWEITPGRNGKLDSYYLKATSGDRYKCKICVGPEGYLPTNYHICSFKSEQTCP